jgi:hypothetical protein
MRSGRYGFSRSIAARAACGVLIQIVVDWSAQSAPCPPGVLTRAAKLTCGATNVASHARRGA